jgi:hypothetical protein
MFISGVTDSVEPPINFGRFLIKHKNRALANDVMTHAHQLQIEDFVPAILEDRSPEVSAKAAKSGVEVFAAMYANHQ